MILRHASSLPLWSPTLEVGTSFVLVSRAAQFHGQPSLDSVSSGPRTDILLATNSFTSARPVGLEGASLEADCPGRVVSG